MKYGKWHLTCENELAGYLELEIESRVIKAACITPLQIKQRRYHLKA